MSICKTRCDDDHLGYFFYNYMRKIPNEICQYCFTEPPRALQALTCGGGAGYSGGTPAGYVKDVHKDTTFTEMADAATGEGETCGSVLSRSIQMAQIFGRLGLVPGDTIVVAGKNHLDVLIPFYAALMSGFPLAGLDPKLKKNEIKHMLRIVKPRIAFCDYEYLEEYDKAAKELVEEIDMKIVSFGGGDSSFEKLMGTYKDLPAEEDFRVASINPDEAYCWLCSTSGTTGAPKIVARTHSKLKELKHYRIDKPTNGERRPSLNFSTLQWISGLFNALVMPINHIMVQTSAPVTTEHVIDIINKYKPAAVMTTPTLLAPILHHEKYCDLTCFDIFKIGGSKIYIEFLKGLRARIREDAIIHQGYGQSEGVGMATKTDEPYGNVGKLSSRYEGKLRDPETGKDILEPNVVGELLVKRPMMACYFNDPKATREAFTDDGYYETGDLFYKDENGLYYFVDRLKMMLKYKNHQVIPSEVEELILGHPGVADVCVSGIPHPDDGDHIVACVVRRQGAKITAQEIKELVAERLTDSKRLRGGVVFLDALPTTSSGKVARMEVKKLVLTAHRE